MYKYEYETVSCTLDGWGPLGGNDYQIGDYRSIIDRELEMVGDTLAAFLQDNEEQAIQRKWI